MNPTAGNGTEVITRVDRVLGDRRVPQGAVGRVVATKPEGLDVMLVGIGVVRYQREELSPRKVGQLRHAERRGAAWGALTPFLLWLATKLALREVATRQPAVAR